ncbi:MAG: DUF5677 domain-containing protein [Nanoarchaeota archaeon]
MKFEKLEKAVSNLFLQFEKLSDSIDSGEVGHQEHYDYRLWINHQIIPLMEAFDLLKKNSYKSSFSLIRTAFESFWIINLTMNGIKHFSEYEFSDNNEAKKVYQSWLNQLKEKKEEKPWKHILEIKAPKKKKIKMVFDGVVNLTNGGGEIMPWYYFNFKEYDSEVAYLGVNSSSFGLEGHEEFSKRIKEKHQKLKYFFNFSNGVKESLLLNELISEAEFERARVHYNFLSTFVHPSANSFDFIHGNNYGRGGFEDIKKDNPDLYHLALLYIGNVLCLYLKAFLKFAERQIKEGKIIKVKFREDFDKAIIEFQDCSAYFWFINNEPARYYKLEHAISLLNKGSQKIEVDTISSSEIEYPKNPLNALKRMASSWHNQILGHYKSPFEEEK